LSQKNAHFSEFERRCLSLAMLYQTPKSSVKIIDHYAMNESDRRKSERFDLKLSTELSYSGKDKKIESIELMTSNICSGGAYLATDSPLPMGTEVKMAMILSLDNIQKMGGQRSRIDVSGSVVRTESQGMAIFFDRKYRISPY
jgi:PilZ domain